MSPYVGEIRMFGGTFAPNGWMFCEGQLIPIAENDVLFALIGTTYGGDGEQTFALPNLASRVPVHQGTAGSGTTYILGQAAGVEEVTLTVQQIPGHTHPLHASTSAGSTPTPQGNVLAASGSSNVYRPAPSAGALSNQTVGPTGGSQPHTNLQPYLCINFIISLFGVFPSQT